MPSLGSHLTRNDIPAATDAIMALAERANWVDHVVVEAASELLFPAIPSGLALLAAGGYGRRQLFPFSDVDLLLLCQNSDVHRANKPAISAFLQKLWDSGLRVSQSVRTPDECVEVHDQNTELNISLLDQRFLAGDRPLFAALSKKFPRFVQNNRDALMRNLARLTRERHTKYTSTFYHLEPNLKDTPGGLRDLQFVRWMEQLRDADANRVTAPEAPEDLQQAFRFLARLRSFLHMQAGRDQNVLTFDAQDMLADNGEGKDVAAWMREYFRHARAVNRAALRSLEAFEVQSSPLFAQFVGWRSRLSNSDFGVHRERIHFRIPQQLQSDPDLILRLFAFVARHGLSLAGETINQIEPRLKSLREYFEEPRNLWPSLSQIFSLPHAPLAVRSMHETGVLFALFPELEQIECLVVRDFYHRYTVDEHTLVAVQNAFSAPAGYGELLQELPHKDLLLFALLFHDSGKGHSDPATGYEGHVDGSLKIAVPVMRRLQMPAQDRAVVTFLIRNHMELSVAMRARDLADPKAIHDVAQMVGTEELLKALTVMTYADISAVNPGAMTPYRSAQLWQLYLKVYRELTRELAAERIADTTGGGAELLEGLPVRYLRTHSEEEIAEHVALEAASRIKGVAVDVRNLDSAWQLTVITADRPGLFAAMAGTLAGFGMNILRAEAFSNRRNEVVDTFVFADPTRTLELNPSEVDRLRTTAEKVILGKFDVEALLKNRPKPKLPSRKQHVATTIRFDDETSTSATLVEILAADRPGLLYDVASAISSIGGNIEVVLIDTQAHRAIDVFYVTVDGMKLSAEKRAALGEVLEKACEPA